MDKHITGQQLQEVLMLLRGELDNKAGRVDWFDNDITSSSHIFNRIGGYYEGTPETIIEETITTSGNTDYTDTPVYSSKTMIDLIDGVTYIITFDDREYVCTTWKIGDSIYLGNGSLLWSDVIDTAEPFLIIDNEQIYVEEESASTHSIKVESLEATRIHLIPQGFLQPLIPECPTHGNYVLQCQDGVLTWVLIPD